VLVATDIAARGIDVDELSHVINYELPNIPETYVHRIGRTGRAGHDGIALSFCDAEETEFLRDIHKLIGKNVPVINNHPYVLHISESTVSATPVRQGQGRNDNRRGSGRPGNSNGRSAGSSNNGGGQSRNQSPRPQSESQVSHSSAPRETESSRPSRNASRPQPQSRGTGNSRFSNSSSDKNY